MRFLEVDLDGTVVRALLNEKGAPKTCEAIWNSLPFEGRAIHAIASGDMFRMLDKAPMPKDLEIESQNTFQRPGAVVYLPAIQEIAFCYNIARFQGRTGPSYVTPLAQIEGDVTPFADTARTMIRQGTRPIRFRRAADQATPFRYPTRAGKKIVVEFGKARVTATLLEDLAPRTIGALLKKLPLTGVSTHGTWGGLVSRLWPGSYGAALDLGISETEQGRHLLWQGFMYYEPKGKSLHLVYGDGFIGDVDAGPRPVTPIAALDGDWEAYRAEAASQTLEGEKPIRISLA